MSDSVLEVSLIDVVLIGASVDSGSFVGVDTVSAQPGRVNTKQKVIINAVILFIIDAIVVEGKKVVNGGKLRRYPQDVCSTIIKIDTVDVNIVNYEEWKKVLKQ